MVELMQRYKGVALLALLLVLVGLLSGCGTGPSRSVAVGNPSVASTHATGSWRGNEYVVARGDTLVGVARRLGVPYQQLASWNGISSPYTIYPGQRLAIKGQVARAAGSGGAPSGRAPATTTTSGTATASSATTGTTATSSPTRKATKIRWEWPTKGQVLSGFNGSDAIPGIEIAGNLGDPVHAAADGTVVYSGNGLVGYGELVILRHEDGFISAYAHNSKRLVSEGDTVKAGQKIAEIGSTSASRNKLRFQIRSQGNPVDPLQYLPPR